MAGPQVFDIFRLKLATPGFNWATADVRAVVFLADTWTPDPTDQFIVDATTAGAIETSGSSADRQALTTQVAAIVSHKANMSADPISYPGIANTDPFDTVVLFVQVTNDSDSWMLAAFDLGAQTGDGSNVGIDAPSGWFDL